MASPAVIFLTGAPLASSLSWRPEDLTAELLPCFGPDPVRHDAAPNASIRPAWRVLPLDQEHLKTGLTQASQEEWQPQDEETSFLDTRELSLSSEKDLSQYSEDATGSQDGLPEPKQAISQFLEHSIAIHEDIPSSQLQGISAATSPSISVTNSFTSSQSSHPSPRTPIPIPRAGQITNLSSIPNAFHLNSIIPQTMTVNLIVGVISMPQSRTIITRKGGRMLELIEMTVGDETKAGFGINLWLPPTSSNPDALTHMHPSLRDVAATLRPRDVILARNVALTSFRGNVYGQSLRKEVTKLDLLFRNLVDRTDVGGAYKTSDLRGIDGDEQLQKVRRVRDWVSFFVGVPEVVEERQGRKGAGGGLDERARKRVRVLPADTQ